jgi:plastocyanin
MDGEVVAMHMKILSRHRILPIALAAVLALTAAACGSSSGGGGGASSSTPTTSGGGGGGGTPIDVTLKDFSIAVAKSGSIPPGTYTFHVSNDGPSSHNLTVNGPGVANKATSTFAPGGSEDLTVTLSNGTYDLYCSVPGHKAAGMDTKLVVGSGGAASGGGSSSGGGGSSSSGGGWA